MEVGFTLSGSPILSVGSMNLMKSMRAAMDATSQPDSEKRTRAIYYVIAAIAVVGVGVWAINELVDDYEAIDEIYDDPKD